MPEVQVINPEQHRNPARYFGRDEMNLSEFPLALLTDTAKNGQKTLFFESPQGRLTVTGSDAFGLPTALDSDVLVALLSLTKHRNNFSDAKVNFSKYEVLKILGWPDKGGSYKRLEESFHRWSGVLLIYDKCWWDKRTKRYISRNLHIIESAAFCDPGSRSDGIDGELPLSAFTWGNIFFESCKAGNLRFLDLEEFRKLKHPSSKQLYRFLGKRFYNQSDLTFDLKELAFERVGLSREYSDAGKIKEKLQPALTELESIGFIEPLTKAERYQKIEKGKWTIRLHQKKETVSVSAVEATPVLTTPHPLVQELVTRGVTESVAVSLTDEFPDAAVSEKIEQFDFLAAKNDPKVSKSPSGYLVSSIRGRYATPKGFISRAEEARRQEIKETKARVVAEEKQRQARADAAERAEIAALDARFQAMSPEERQAIEQAALNAADNAARETYQSLRRLKAGSVFLMTLVRDYLREPVTTDPSLELA